jgi:hypothetical protein
MILAGCVETRAISIIEALTKYGGYFGDGGGVGASMWGIEGAGAYLLQGGLASSPLYDWLKTNPAFDSTRDPDGSHPSMPLYCEDIIYQGVLYKDCAMSPFVAIPSLPGPTCDATSNPNSCYVSVHMHIADPCVALGLAGQPGGCLSACPETGSR